MSNEEIVEKIQAGNSSYLEDLYLQNKPLIKKIIKPYSNYETNEDDLIQEAFFGLRDAAYRFDSAFGVRFMTFAKFHIIHSIQVYLHGSKLVAVPFYLSEKMQQYKKFESGYFAEHGRKPSKKEIEEQTGITQKQQELIKTIISNISSLDEPIGAEDDDYTLLDSLSSGQNLEEESLDKLYKEKAESDLWKALESTLSGRETKIIEEYIIYKGTLESIAVEMGISPERVRQIIKSSLEKFKIRNRKLLESYAETEGLLYHSGYNTFINRWESVVERVAVKKITALEEYRLQRQKDYEKYFERIKKC